MCREGAWAELTAEVTFMIAFRDKTAWIFIFQKNAVNNSNNIVSKLAFFIFLLDFLNA